MEALRKLVEAWRDKPHYEHYELQTFFNTCLNLLRKVEEENGSLKRLAQDREELMKVYGESEEDLRREFIALRANVLKYCGMCSGECGNTNEDRCPLKEVTEVIRFDDYKGRMVIECNGCGHSETISCNSFNEGVRELKSRGWKIFCQDGEWEHWCHTCR